MKPFRIIFRSECNLEDHEIERNILKSNKYPRVRFGKLASRPPMALVGGGPSAKESLDILREWKGDVYGINDMAGYLSDNGVRCSLYAIDGTTNLYKIGPLVKDALLASRAHRNNYDQFEFDKIQVFDVVEDAPGGICGGSSAACRAAHLFTKMGYSQVHYFGIDGCVKNANETHVSHFQKVSQNYMLIVKAGGIDYLTNADWYIQTAFLSELIPAYANNLFNRSEGLLAAMIKYPDTWEVVAISHDTFDAVTEDHKHQTFAIPYTKEYFEVGERYGVEKQADNNRDDEHLRRSLRDLSERKIHPKIADNGPVAVQKNYRRCR
jgi:hypothetical protein